MAQFKVSQGDASYNVTVPDEFLNLPQEQQHSQLAAAFAQHLGGSAAPAAPAEAPDTSLAGALGYGADSVAHSIGNTAEVLGAGPNAFQRTQMAPKNYQPVSITGDFKAGKYSSLPGDFLRKGVEMVPAVGGLAAAGAGAVAAAPEAIATGVGLGTSALLSSALHYGDNVKASAANNEHAQPSTGDYVRGAITTVPQAALDSVGIRVPGLTKVATSTLGKAAVRTGADATTAGASDQVGQVGTSIGTEKGLQDDPTQSLEAALGTLPARAITTAPGVAKAGIKAGSDAAMSRLVAQPTDLDHAAAIEQANQAMDSARSSIKGTATPTAVANSAKSQVAETLKSTFSTLSDNYPELLSRDDKSNFAATLNQALRHNNATGESNNPNVATLLDQVAGLNLPPEATGPLVSGLRALDVLSNASFANQTVGPFRALGSAAAQVGSVAGLAMHNPIEGAIAGVGLLTGAGKPVGKVGGAIGGLVDNALGTSAPRAVFQRAAALRALKKAGVDVPGDPVAALQAVRDAAGDRPATTPDLQGQNQAASAAYGAAQERDSAAVTRAQAQAAALRQQQIDAAHQQNANPAPAPTSSPDFARAQAQLPQAPDPSAAYLAGKAVPGMDGTSPLGAQTAAEIAGWTQMQRNHAAALADAQRAMKALQASEDARAADAANASAAYGSAVERDAGTLAKQQAQAATLKQQQIAAAYQQNARTPSGTNASSFDRAEAQLPQAPDPSAAYLAGKSVPGMEPPPASVAPQTRAEISAYVQEQRAKAAALAHTVAVGQKANAAQPDVAGQMALDASARRNATLLAAADRVPSTNPGVTDVAADAAVSQARARAASVMRAAGVEPPDEVGNPGNPVPINTPISAPQPRAPQAPPAAPMPQAPLPPPQAPQGAPAAPQGAPGGTPGWMRYIQHADPGITPAHIDQAIDGRVASGAMTPQYAAQLRAHTGVAPSDVLQPIQADAARLAAHDRASVGLPAQGFGPAPHDPTVQRPAAYLYATQAYHLDVSRLADAADKAGLPNVSDVVATIGHTRDPAAKAQLRADFLSHLPPDQQAAASRFLPDRLITHGKK